MSFAVSLRLAPQRSQPVIFSRVDAPSTVDDDDVSEPLLPLVAAGDASAIDRCLDRYGGLIWSLARRMCPVQSEAEDAVQEIFVELWRQADRFQPEIAGETTFVAMIARRRLIDRRRRRRLPVAALEDAPVLEAPAESETLAENRDEAERVRAALDELSEDARNAVLLSVCEGFTHQEVAERLNLPLGTVKSHIRRGLIRVREILGCQPAGREG